ncbi:Cytochrome P450 OS=Streptomyces violarus OX=67380 GN=FHS41_000433 PE=3 SV=1 [Streptomyces violarus]
MPAWLVLGYRDNRRVLDNPRQFSRDARIWRDWAQGRVEETSPLIPMLGWRPDCVSQDGEPHRRLRSAVTDGLQAAATRGIRRHATHFANKQINAFADTGRADLVPDYAEYLPMPSSPASSGCPRWRAGTWSSPAPRSSRAVRTPSRTTSASC